MSANGISELVAGDGSNATDNKEARQIAKLNLAQTRRQAGGDVTQDYYRTLNVYDRIYLPEGYNVSAGSQVWAIEGRPWYASAVTALFTSLGAEFEIRVDDTTGISPGMIMTGMDYGGATVTVVTVNSSTSLEMSIIAPDTVPAAGTVLTFTNP